MKKTSIRTIASALELSAATVSRALSDSPLVAPETRRKILESARELGYRRTQKRKRLMVALSDRFYRGVYDLSLLEEILQQCRSRDYELLLATESNFHSLKEYAVDGLFSLCYNRKTNQQLARSYRCPLVCFNNYECHREGIFSVNSDEAGAIAAAVELFHANGHRRIALLAGVNIGYSNWKRREQFQLAIDRRPELTGFLYEFYVGTEFVELTPRIRADKVTALLLPHEGFDLHLLRHLEKAALHVPRDISVIAWENPQLSKHTLPPLTTFCQNYPRMADEGIRLLENLLQLSERQPRNILIPYLSLKRQSVAPPLLTGKRRPLLPGIACGPSLFATGENRNGGG